MKANKLSRIQASLLGLLLLGGCSSVVYDGQKKTSINPEDRWLAVSHLRNNIQGDPTFVAGFGQDGFIGTGSDQSGQMTTLNCPYSLTPHPMMMDEGVGTTYTNVTVKLNCIDKKELTIHQLLPFKNEVPNWNGSFWLASVIQSLANYPRNSAEEQKFKEAAQVYRTKPNHESFDDETRPYKIGAEIAVKEKRLKDAVIQYRKGLNQVPTWPLARFNLALIYAELKIIDGAVDEMEKYLSLVPDAKNARQAQDKIYEWKSKILSK